VSFQPDFKITKLGNLIEIDDGSAVTFYSKDFSRTLKSIITKIKQQQPDLQDEDLEYHRQNIEAQLLQIYSENSEKAEKPHTNKKHGRIDNQNSVTAFKYSDNGKGTLHETIILDGRPVFLKYENGEIKTVVKIQENNRTISPPNSDEYAYDPYEFDNQEELKKYMDMAKLEIFDTMFGKAKQIIDKYNDQDDDALILIAADVVWSYFQDLFPTTHYLDVTGDNNVGKSSLGYTFQSIGYRPVKGTAISAANYYRTLGTVEPGQCIIIEDEADHISDDPDKMRILKTGNEYNAKVPKINMNTLEQKQSWYYPYCFKIIIAERSLDQYKAKGLSDRTLAVKCRPGSPRCAIKEIINYYRTEDVISYELHNELVKFRKTMFCFRLLHYNDSFTYNISGLRNRDKELCGPLLQLFQNTKAQSVILNAVTTFLSEKKERKSNSLEVALYSIIVNLIGELREYEISADLIWTYIRTNIDGVYDDRRPNEFKTLEYGDLYKNTITKIIVDKFCSLRGRRRSSSGSILIFDKNKIERFAVLYDRSINIKIENVSSVGSVGNVGSEGCTCTDIEVYRRVEKHDIQLFDKSPYAILIGICTIPDDYRIASTLGENWNSTKLTVNSSQSLGNQNLTYPKTINTNSASIYRIGRTDNFACQDCRKRGDKWYMLQHICSRKR
jgi:hypothetical protein